ncbi:SurA N-terminal domain-containing protein [Halolactibacillus sp. JCM 19043]|uniref:SurA N-terminal domain-containing protein n=1 Tax=Halolactibacillus sp. JCM 19043 TaxID=1460638 RepID=UPI0007801DC7|nr:SurA N-terminal domain-containing protein [Halolactibacillus sp. JCM 19043]
MKKTLQLFLGLLLTTTVLVACGNESAEEETPEEEPNQEATDNEDTSNDSSEETPALDLDVSDDETVADDQVVLEVNGEEVLGDAYNTAYVDTKRYLLQNNQDASDKDMLKEQTLQTLQSNTLVKQDAKEQGITITDDDVAAALEETKSQFETEEAYQQALNQLAYTEESFKVSLQTQLLQQQYLEDAIEVESVTDEEVEEYYNLVKEQSDDVPPLEDVKEQIVAQLEQTKVQQAFQAKVTSLMEEAEINENI